MKIYILTKGVVLVGKAWEVCLKLKENRQHYETIEQWIQSSAEQKNQEKVIPFKRKAIF
jgi:hypothetical protein